MPSQRSSSTELVAPTSVLGCFVIHPSLHVDGRGVLVKPFSAEIAQLLDRDFIVKELFWSISRRGVLRGLHYQRPPAAVSKLIWCTSGRILDVVVDLREGATFGTVAAVELSADEGTAIYVPVGCAHGFLALSEAAVAYAQSGPFASEHDAGVRWDSIDFEWPHEDRQPIVSDRDRHHPPLERADAGF